jgi:hypothetical protein
LLHRFNGTTLNLISKASTATYTKVRTTIIFKISSYLLLLIKRSMSISCFRYLVKTLLVESRSSDFLMGIQAF